MDGLIDQAKSQLWRIVNEFAGARQNGKSPQLQVALYEYGKSSLPAGEGFLRQILPFTSDLDRVSEELFKLTTLGGEEYCGWVIRDAVQGLTWRKGRNGDLKVIFIAGNEPFTQGPVDPRRSCEAAAQQGILVNTVFCGPESTGISSGWKAGADRAGGRFMAIDHNQKVAYVKAPQDEKIARLSALLNETYVPYGASGAAGQSRQEAQDRAAHGVSSEVLAQRAVAKSGRNYTNSTWDLCDAVKEGRVRLDDVKNEELPSVLKDRSVEQRKRYVEGKLKERENLQSQIKQLSAERDRYVAGERRKAALCAAPGGAGGSVRTNTLLPAAARPAYHPAAAPATASPQTAATPTLPAGPAAASTSSPQVTSGAASSGATLDEAVIKTIREQAARKGYGF